MNRHYLRTFVLVAIGSFLGLPSKAWAEDSLGSVICNMQQNMAPYVDFISAIVYIAGAFYLAHSVMMFKQHSENPNQAPMSRCVMHMLGGAACLVAPKFAAVVQQTLMGASGAGGGMVTCSGTIVAPTSLSGATTGMDQIFGNLFNNIAGPMQVTLSVLSFLIGALWVGKGLMKAAKYGTDPRAASVQSILSNLFVGAVLISIGQLTDVVMNTVFGYSSSSMHSFVINWGAVSGDTTADGLAAANRAVKAVLIFIQVIGMIAFLRGWMIIKSAVEGSGQATMAQGITHIVGGVMAINIGGMATILNYTFGLNVITSS